MQIHKTKGVFLEAYGKPTSVKEIDIPALKENQVLVKVEAAPINPSDLSYLNGFYASQKLPPCIAGFEGAGTIVEVNGAQYQPMIGKRVAFTPDANQPTGTYGEYCISTVWQCIQLPEDVSFELGACSFVNPFTVVSMAQLVQAQNVKAVVHTAAASALGRQMVSYFQKKGIEVINVVRRQEQVDILKQLGAKHILNQTDSDFEQKLKQLAEQLQATIGFDAIAGEIAGKVINAMPPKSTLYVYGGLSGTPVSGIGIGDLIFQEKVITGFWLVKQMERKSMQEKLAIGKEVTSLLSTDLKTNIAKTFTYDQFNEAVQYQQSHQSEGKVIITHQ